MAHTNKTAQAVAWRYRERQDGGPWTDWLLTTSPVFYPGTEGRERQVQALGVIEE